MLKIISNNPYRILGVFANSSSKERLANKNRSIAFLKVNKHVFFDLDLKDILSPINRTVELINQAENSIALIEDKIKYAQFWFIKETPFDEIAFNHLYIGNIDKAKEIWTKKETVSSLQNLIVCLLIEEKYESALKTAEDLYKSYDTQFVNHIFGKADTKAKVNNNNLLLQFIDTLGNEIGLSTLFYYQLPTEIHEHIKEKATEPLVQIINSEINTAKQKRKDGPAESLKYGHMLYRKTVAVIEQLQGLLGKNDLKYKLNADKLGNEILQCAIDYYNKSDDSDYPIKALELAKKASEIVIGKIAKDRCKENTDVIQRAADEMEPPSVSCYDKLIKKELYLFYNKEKKSSVAIELIKKCVPYLASIKEILGIDHKYYISISTKIADAALNYIIEECNQAIDAVQNNKSKLYPNDYQSVTQRALYMQLERAISIAYNATKYIEVLDCSESFQENRLFDHQTNLMTFVSKLGIIKNSSINLDWRSEKQIYNSCRSIDDYNNLLKTFPDCIYSKQAKNQIEQIKLRDAARRKKAREEKERLINEIKSCTNLEDVLKLKYKCNDSDTKRELDKKYFSLCNQKSDFKLYLKTFGDNAIYRNEAEKKLRVYLWIKKHIIFISSVILLLIASLIIFGIWGKEGWAPFMCIITILLFISIFISFKNENPLFLILSIITIIPSFVITTTLFSEYSDYKKLCQKPTIADCMEFTNRYFISPHHNDAIDIYYSCVTDSGSILQINEFVSEFGFTDKGKKAKQILEEKCDYLYEIASEVDIIETWEDYRNSVPESFYRDSKQRIDSIDKSIWSNEETAWNQAKLLDNDDAYNKYLQFHPKGHHAYKAKQKIELLNKEKRTITETLLSDNNDKKEILLNKYKNNSLNTGATPYRNIYGKNSNYGHSILRITAPHGSDIIVIIKNSHGKVVKHAYIKAAESYKFTMPAGTYQPFFIYGNSWCPEIKSPNGSNGYFLENVSVSKDFPQHIGEYEELTYVLQLSMNGNFRTAHSNENEAF